MKHIIFGVVFLSLTPLALAMSPPEPTTVPSPEETCSMQLPQYVALPNFYPEACLNLQPEDSAEIVVSDSLSPADYIDSNPHLSADQKAARKKMIQVLQVVPGGTYISRKFLDLLVTDGLIQKVNYVAQKRYINNRCMLLEEVFYYKEFHDSRVVLRKVHFEDYARNSTDNYQLVGFFPKEMGLNVNLDYILAGFHQQRLENHVADLEFILNLVPFGGGTDKIWNAQDGAAVADGVLMLTSDAAMLAATGPWKGLRTIGTCTTIGAASARAGRAAYRLNNNSGPANWADVADLVVATAEAGSATYATAKIIRGARLRPRPSSFDSTPLFPQAPTNIVTHGSTAPSIANILVNGIDDTKGGGLGGPGMYMNITRSEIKTLDNLLTSVADLEGAEHWSRQAALATGDTRAVLVGRYNENALSSSNIFEGHFVEGMSDLSSNPKKVSVWWADSATSPASQAMRSTPLLKIFPNDVAYVPGAGIRSDGLKMPYLVARSSSAPAFSWENVLVYEKITVGGVQRTVRNVYSIAEFLQKYGGSTSGSLLERTRSRFASLELYKWLIRFFGETSSRSLAATETPGMADFVPFQYCLSEAGTDSNLAVTSGQTATTHGCRFNNLSWSDQRYIIGQTQIPNGLYTTFASSASAHGYTMRASVSLKRSTLPSFPDSGRPRNIAYVLAWKQNSYSPGGWYVGLNMDKKQWEIGNVGVSSNDGWFGPVVSVADSSLAYETVYNIEVNVTSDTTVSLDVRDVNTSQVKHHLSEQMLPYSSLSPNGLVGIGAQGTAEFRGFSFERWFNRAVLN